MARADLTRILRIFYSSGLRYLPVVEDEQAGADQVIGFVPRVRLDREMADLSRAGRDLDELPPELILTEALPEDLIASLSGAQSVPVLTRTGASAGTWTSAETLRAIAVYREAVGQLPAEPAVSEQAPAVEPESVDRDGAAWLARLILSEISFPLFVSDLEGRTLFYNQAFETAVLNHTVLKKSIRLAEEFLLEVQRTLLARSIQEGGTEGRLLRTRIEELETSVDIISLASDGKLVGYLYVFRGSAQTGLYDEVARMLEGKLSYDEIVDDVESHIILSMLARYEQNVSHTAKALKLRRTTLQNKIKRLGLDTRRPVHGPIPRHRRTKDELEAERIRSILAEAEKKSAAGTQASPASNASAGKSGHMSDLIGEIARDVAAKRGVPGAGSDARTRRLESPVPKSPAPKKASANQTTVSSTKLPPTKKSPAKKKTAGSTTPKKKAANKGVKKPAQKQTKKHAKKQAGKTTKKPVKKAAPKSGKKSAGTAAKKTSAKKTAKKTAKKATGKKKSR